MAISNLVNIKIKAVENLSEKLDGIKKSTEGVSKGINGFKNKIDGLQPTFQRISGFGATMFAGFSYGILKTTKDAGQLESSLKGLQSIVEGTGGDFAQAQKYLESYTKDGLVPMTNASTALKNLISKGFSLKEATVLMDRFKDSAAFGRQASLSLGEAVQSATEGIKNENSILVDNAGVTKNISVMQEEYAKSLGKTVNNLTEAEQREAIYQGIIKETAFQVGDAQKASEGYQGAVARLNATKLQLSTTIGTALMPAMTKVMETITPIIEKIGLWIQKNPELTSKIIIATTAIVGLVAIIGTLGMAIPAIVTGFNGIIVVVKALGVALRFLALNPVGMIITALVALGVAGWTLYKNWDEVKSNLIILWNQIKIDVSGIIDGLAEWMVTKWDSMGKSAKEWAGNMIQMFMDGIISKWNSLKDAVSAVSQTLADFLGFHSPTKKGAGKDADKWMPNLINMLAYGLGEGNLKIEEKAKAIANTLSSIGQKFKVNEIGNTLTKVADMAKSAFSDVTSNIQTSIDKIKTLKGELEEINKTISNLGGQKKSATQEGKMGIANRAIELEKQIASIQASGEPSDKLAALQEELNFANSLLTQEEKSYAIQLASRTETQVLLATMQEKVMAIDNEIFRQQEQASQKQKQIKEEEIVYKKLVQTKIALDNQYFSLFGQNIEVMKTQIQQTINMLREMNALSGGRSVMAVGAKAVGGRVTAGSTYRVNEQGQEFFTPTQSGYITPAGKGGGITFTMGNVNVYNEADEDRLIEKMKRMLTQEAKNYNLGIS